jgi:hypothetical protein
MPRKGKGRKPTKKIEEPSFHIIGLGDQKDWEAGRGSIYYIEDKNGEKCVPVFTTAEGVQRYIAANFNLPEAHMDMMEGMPESHIQPLTEGRFIIMPLPAEQVIQAAGMTGADYLMRDPRPGSEQEIIRLDGLYEDEG